MSDVHVPPQPGSLERAPQLLPLGRLGAFIVFSTLFCVFATFGFLWLARAIFANRFVTIDDAVLTWAHGYWGPTLNQVMLFFTTMGSTLVLSVFVVLAALALLRSGRWIDAAGLVVAGAGAGLLNQLLKTIYQRVRPDLFEGPFHLTSYSFPSGHSMGSIACYGMLTFLGVRLLKRPIHKVLLVLVAALLILGIGFSRVYFDVHYPTDVIGGFIAGGAWLAITIGLLEIAEWYVQRRAPQQDVL